MLQLVRRPRSVLAASSALLLVSFGAACAVPTEPSTRVEIDGDVAKVQAQALSAAVASADVDDGLAVAAALASASGVSAALVPDARRGVLPKLDRETTTCACDAIAKTCVFDACRLGAATVNGSLAWGDGTIRATKLTFDIPPRSDEMGASYAAVNATLGYEPGLVHGKLHTTGSAAVDGVVYRWTSSIDVEDVTFTPASFTGGAVVASAAVTVALSSSDARTFEGTGVVALP